MSQQETHQQHNQVQLKTSLLLKIPRTCPVIGKCNHPSLKTWWGRGGGGGAKLLLDEIMEYNAFAIGLIKAKFLFTV